jgi:hypothetical protein
VGRLVDWPSLFRRNLRSSDLPDRFCLPSIYLVVDVWGSLVMVETNPTTGMSLVVRAPAVAPVNRCVTHGRSSLAACFCGRRAQFRRAIRLLPLWGNVLPLPRVSASHVPGLWCKLVAFACGSTSPDVQVNFPLVMGA